jgi:hypothetical protein
MHSNEHCEEPDITPQMLLGMRDAGIPPQFIYAYRKTGVFVLSEGWQQNLPPDALEKWEKAIQEYFTLEDEAKGQAS